MWPGEAVLDVSDEKTEKRARLATVGSNVESNGAEEEAECEPIETRKYAMLFHITQDHAPELCPKSAGGSKTLYDSNAKGVKVLAIYGAFAEHVIYYVVEANDLKAVNEFLLPGFERCTSTVTPVSDVPIVQ
jgi:hypothetical protein